VDSHPSLYLCTKPARLRNFVTTAKRLTKVATADAVDKRVAAAGGEDERLRDGVENTE